MNGWIECWEAASIEVLRRVRHEWREQAEPAEDGQQQQAVEGIGDVCAHGSSEPAGAANGGDGHSDGDLEKRGVERHDSGSSCSRPGDGATLRLDQLRPDGLPVIGAQIAARDEALGGLLDRHAVLWAGTALAVAVLPLANLGVTLGTDPLTQFGNGHSAREGKVLMEVHEYRFCSKSYVTSIAFASVAPANVSL